MPKISKASAGYQYRPETEYRCEECVMLRPLGAEKGKEDAGRGACAWFGPTDPVSPTAGSCNYFAHAGKDHPLIPWLGLLTKIELGYTENKQGFSCKRCEYVDLARRDCEKVDKNSAGDTPGEISPNGCCGFWEPDRKRAKMSRDQLLQHIAALEGDKNQSLDEYRKARQL